MTPKGASPAPGWTNAPGTGDDLQAWLDTQVVTGKLTPAQAAGMLPGYHTPLLGPCLVRADDQADDHATDAEDADGDTAGWG